MGPCRRALLCARGDGEDKRETERGFRVCILYTTALVYLRTSNGWDISGQYSAGLLTLSCPCRHYEPNLRPRHDTTTGPCMPGSQTWA
jgi:hypothetical protein